MSEIIIEGRCWVLVDKDGFLIEDIDTDQIYHNAYLHLTDRKLMGQYALGNLEGWQDFAQKARPGDIVVAGRNFGAGSSRQQAVDCFLALGIAAIVAPSFGAIYFRNAVNSALPVIRWAQVDEWIRGNNLKSSDRLQLKLATGQGRNVNRNLDFCFTPFSGVQLAIIQAGGLFNYAHQLER
ncbi:MAG: 3-isopropylmalate dehydratase [Candidatus Aminicenantes bacterium 4484_214]|nr:MAG: 3-isopropylmalate dehydratase [Candidatus Aminicenantes bacterium 4484_214]RLE06925.1 MAG: 3-isopropylmalate dehydratase [Candidatus Aminicenantes bacterium]HDJ24053.1 3-isopropylmalate dehydratase [Candidatus Aminicenantes bacterium]